jgi:hypothetical protein
MKGRVNKKISFSIEEYKTLISLIEKRLENLDFEIQNETDPAKKFDLKMERSDIEEILLKI